MWLFWPLLTVQRDRKPGEREWGKYVAKGHRMGVEPASGYGPPAVTTEAIQWPVLACFFQNSRELIMLTLHYIYIL